MLHRCGEKLSSLIVITLGTSGSFSILIVDFVIASVNYRFGNIRTVSFRSEKMIIAIMLVSYRSEKMIIAIK
jgi:hypothetical protein